MVYGNTLFPLSCIVPGGRLCRTRTFGHVSGWTVVQAGDNRGLTCSTMDASDESPFGYSDVACFNAQFNRETPAGLGLTRPLPTTGITLREFYALFVLFFHVYRSYNAANQKAASTGCEGTCLTEGWPQGYVRTPEQRFW